MIIRGLAATAALLLLGGCNNEYPGGNESQTASGHLEILAVGLGTEEVQQALDLSVDGETYTLYESGLFERDAASPENGVDIASEPGDGHCVLFEREDDRRKKMASCVPATVNNTDATLSIGRGWTYQTKGEWRAMYNPEQLLNPREENGTIVGEHPDVLEGTFYDDGGAGEKYLYVLPGTTIGALSKSGLDEAVRKLIAQTPGVVSIKRVYSYDTDTFLNTEYRVELSLSLRPPRMMARLAQSLHHAVIGADGIEQRIHYTPSGNYDMEATGTYRVATTVLPYSEYASFYALRCAPESAMGESHFPTTNVGSPE